MKQKTILILFYSVWESIGDVDVSSEESHLLSLSSFALWFIPGYSFLHKALFYPALSERSEQMSRFCCFCSSIKGLGTIFRKAFPMYGFLSGCEHLSLGLNLTLQPSLSRLIMYWNQPNLWPFQPRLWPSMRGDDCTSPSTSSYLL